MILFLRGHIRNSFNTNALYILLTEIIKTVEESEEIDIYIQTWNVFQSNISWRTLEENNEFVTEATIYTYFRDLTPYIKHISILDDTKIKLIGDVTGTIMNTKAPKLGWKNMLYGICNELTYMKENTDSESGPDPLVINTRFDIMTNSFPMSSDFVLWFIKNNMSYVGNIMKVMNDRGCAGIDNIYIGKLNKMRQLLHHLYENLDTIMLKYQDVIHHELIFFYENNPAIPLPNFKKIADDKQKNNTDERPPSQKRFTESHSMNHLMQSSKKTYGKIGLDSVRQKWSKFAI
jgi:hypothetical protein